MLVESIERRPSGFSFVVYPPPEPGFPWIAVCLGPHGQVRGAQTFDTAEGAQAETSRQATLFMAALQTTLPRAY